MTDSTDPTEIDLEEALDAIRLFEETADLTDPQRGVVAHAKRMLETVRDQRAAAAAPADMEGDR